MENLPDAIKKQLLEMPEYKEPKTLLIIMSKVGLMSEALQEKFLDYLKSGKEVLPEYESNNYTLRQLTEQYSFKPVAAFLTMGWIERDPYAAIATLNKGIK